MLLNHVKTKSSSYEVFQKFPALQIAGEGWSLVFLVT